MDTNIILIAHNTETDETTLHFAQVKKVDNTTIYVEVEGNTVEFSHYGCRKHYNLDDSSLILSAPDCHRILDTWAKMHNLCVKAKQINSCVSVLTLTLVHNS